jgi:hypothetical protein
LKPRRRQRRFLSRSPVPVPVPVAVDCAAPAAMPSAAAPAFVVWPPELEPVPPKLKLKAEAPAVMASTQALASSSVRMDVAIGDVSRRDVEDFVGAEDDAFEQQASGIAVRDMAIEWPRAEAHGRVEGNVMRDREAYLFATWGDAMAAAMAVGARHLVPLVARDRDIDNWEPLMAVAALARFYLS